MAETASERIIGGMVAEELRGVADQIERLTRERDDALAVVEVDREVIASLNEEIARTGERGWREYEQLRERVLDFDRGILSLPELIAVVQGV